MLGAGFVTKCGIDVSIDMLCYPFVCDAIF
jgi:hypothetical protein